MSETDHGALCPDDVLAGLVSLLEEDGGTAVSRLEDLVQRFPADARLHFLRGSLMAGRKDYEGARKAMRRAVDLAPDLAIARFQLGFLLLTSGDGWAAQEAWGPLTAWRTGITSTASSAACATSSTTSSPARSPSWSAASPPIARIRR